MKWFKLFIRFIGGDWIRLLKMNEEKYPEDLLKMNEEDYP